MAGTDRQLAAMEEPASVEVEMGIDDSSSSSAAMQAGPVTEKPASWYQFDGVRIAQGYNLVGTCSDLFWVILFVDVLLSV